MTRYYQIWSDTATQMFKKGRFLLNATEFFEMILSQECRAHATQQLDIALASLRDPGPDDELEEDDMVGGVGAGI